MHPAKIAEKNWVDSYKLAQLIEQQEKWLDDTAKDKIFGGLDAIKPMHLDSAFA